MDPAWVVGVVVTVALTVIGWLVTRRNADAQVINTQRETINELKQQIKEFELTAKVTEMIKSHLSKSGERP